ncbi:MAG: aminotransferase class III-fold pyridoxal phosphate-dependent enzyme, partial [Bacteroidota bacterium]
HLTVEVACVIVEGIQGVGGINLPNDQFLQLVQRLCEERGALLILDEIQSGFGRTGQFFAHQYAGIKPHLVTIAKGMGNGFPIGGVLIHPDIEPSFGLLGTTFGGNHLACAAGMAVLEVLEKENLLQNALEQGELLKSALEDIEGVVSVRGRGLMLAAEFDQPVRDLRKNLVTSQHCFTGASSNPNVLRLLPSLGIGEKEVTLFMDKLKSLTAHIHG